MEKKRSDVLGVKVSLEAGEKSWAVAVQVVGGSTVIGLLIMLKQFGVW
ncbi:hypothetical protein [Litoribrevibacter albus]|nr:hypothetical protein [Litoribrevibacter albus]